MTDAQTTFRTICQDVARGVVVTADGPVSPPWVAADNTHPPSWVPHELRTAATSFTWDAPPPISTRARVLILSIAAHGCRRAWDSPSVLAIADTIHLFSLTTAWSGLVNRPGWQGATEAVQHWISRRTVTAEGATRVTRLYWPLLVAVPRPTAAWTDMLTSWSRPRGAVVGLSLLECIERGLKERFVDEAATALLEPGSEQEHAVFLAAFETYSRQGFNAWVLKQTDEMRDPKAGIQTLLSLATPHTVVGFDAIARAAPLPKELLLRLTALPAHGTAQRTNVARLVSLWCAAGRDPIAKQAVKAQLLFQNGPGSAIGSHIPLTMFTEVATGCLTFSAAWLYNDLVWPSWQSECARRGCCPSDNPLAAWDCLVLLATPTVLPSSTPVMDKTLRDGVCSMRLSRVTARFPHLRAPLCLYHQVRGERARRRRSRLQGPRHNPLLRARQISAFVFSTLHTELPFLPMDLTRVVADIVACSRGRHVTEGVCMCCASKMQWIS